MRYANLLSVAALMSLFLYPFFPVLAANDISVVNQSSSADITPRSIKGEPELFTPLAPAIGMGAVVGGAAVITAISNSENGNSSNSSRPVTGADVQAGVVGGVVSSIHQAVTNSSTSSSSSGSSVGQQVGQQVGDKVGQQINNPDNGGGSTSPSSPTNPSSPTIPNSPTVPSSPFDTSALLKAIKDWRDRWVAEFNRLGQRMVNNKESLAKGLESCARFYTIGSNSHKDCSDRVIKNYEKIKAELEELFEKAKQKCAEEYATLQERINAEVGVKTPSLSFSGGATAIPGANSNDGVCKINGVWQPCSGVGTSANPDLAGGVGAVNGANVGVNTGVGANSTANTSTTTNTSTSTTTNTSTSNSQSTTHNQTVNNVTNNYGIQEMPNIESMTDFCKANPTSLMCTKGVDLDVSGYVLEADNMFSRLKETLNENRKEFEDYVYKNFVGSEMSPCPAPVTVSIMGSNLVFSYDFLCDFLLLIRKIVIAVFSFSTMIFVIGRVR